MVFFLSPILSDSSYTAVVSGVQEHAGTFMSLVKIHQFKENETIGDRFKVFHVPRYLDTVVRYKLLNVSICAQRGPQYFNVLYREHIQSKIILDTLQGKFILEEIFIQFM